MRCLDAMDIIDGVLSFLCGQVEIERLDINLIVGMVSRLIFFIIMISDRDLRTYTFKEFFSQVGAWAIFHIYIFGFERKYFSEGQSNTKMREYVSKIMDILQQLIGVIYLALNFESDLELAALIIFSINLGLGVLELIKSFFLNNHIENYSKEGGLQEFFIGSFLGILGVIIFLIFSANKYWDEISEESSKAFSLIFTLIGQFILMFLAYVLATTNSAIRAKDWTKSILGFLYGLTFGVFSIFYGYLIGLYLFFYMLYQCTRQMLTPRRVQPEAEI